MEEGVYVLPKPEHINIMNKAVEKFDKLPKWLRITLTLVVFTIAQVAILLGKIPAWAWLVGSAVPIVGFIRVFKIAKGKFK